MAQNKNTNSNVAAVLRGMREVARVTFTKKPVETDFMPEKPDLSKKPEETATTDDKVPLRKISGNNELIVAPEYIPDMVRFFGEHAIFDSLAVPCYFNNDSCDLTLCVFPRIMRPPMEQPFVKDIIAVTIQYNGTIVAMAEYNTMDDKAAEHFKKDINDLTPEYYRSNHNNNPQHSLRDALLAKFPGLVVPEEPVFLEQDIGKESPHAI